jgi:hypothetical protein
MIAAPAGLRIERVPCMLIQTLRDKIPPIPVEIAAMSFRLERRQPTPSEAGELTWVLAHQGEFDVIDGILAYRDRYDWHISCDVREVVYVAGSATIRMLKWLRKNTMKRRLVGALDSENTRMARAIAAIGWKPTRVIFEVEP